MNDTGIKGCAALIVFAFIAALNLAWLAAVIAVIVWVLRTMGVIP